MQFDPNVFQDLSGLQASGYALELVKKGIANGDFVVAYFKEHIATLDLPHLEVAIFLLAKIGTDDAWPMVADYINHPNFSVRFVAIKTIKAMTSVNEMIMKKIVKELSRSKGDGLADDLNPLLAKPLDSKAAEVAKQYVASTKF